MNNRWRFVVELTILTLIIASATSRGAAKAGSVKGTVRDAGMTPPQDAVPGARVRLRNADKKLLDPEVVTNAAGEYQIPDVPVGTYTIVVVRGGYIPRPHDSTPVTVAGDNKAPDVVLMQDAGTNAYYAVVADQIVKSVGMLPNEEHSKAFSSSWDRLRVINLPPSSKAILASELDKKDSRVARAVPEFSAYAKAKPQDLLKAETLLQQALAGSTGLPGRDHLRQLGVNDDLAADLILFQVKASDESPGKRNSFLQQFMLNWEDTDAPKKLMSFLEKDSNRVPGIEVPK